MSRNTLAAVAAIAPSLAIPMSARTMRVAYPRPSDGIMWAEVTSGGSGYTNGSAVSFTGGGGSGAVGVALVRSGAVVGVAISSTGSGYTGNATAVFTGGTGAAATGYRVDPVNDLKAAHATDCVWHYATEPAFVSSVVAAGLRIQGAISGLVDYNASNTINASACAVSFNGQPVPVAWLLGASKAFGASGRAGYRALQLASVSELLALGITSVHMDDPAPDVNGALHAASPAYTGGPFDSETLTTAGVPNLVATLQGLGYTQDAFNWTSQTFTTTSSNWEASYNSMVAGTGWAGYDAFVSSLKQMARDVHAALKGRVGSGLWTINAGDPFPKSNASAFMLPGADGVVFETDTQDYSGASKGAATRFSRMWVNIQTVNGAGKLCIPHLQPLRNTSTEVATRAERIDLLKRQTALAYALGGRPTYPYDVYCFPFDASNQNERFFAKSTDGFIPLFKFVRDYPELFDATSQQSAMLLAYDVDKASQTHSAIMAQAEVCLRNGIPAVIYPVGQGFERNTAAEAAALKIVNCSGIGTTSPSAITPLLPGVIDLSAFGTSLWSVYSAAKLAGTFTDVFAVPRLSASGGYQAHVVSFDAATATNLKLTVPHWAMPNYERSATWYEPGSAPRQLVGIPTDQGMQFALPAVSLWGVLTC